MVLQAFISGGGNSDVYLVMVLFEMWCGGMQCDVVWCGVVWYGMVWCDVVWCGVV